MTAVPWRGLKALGFGALGLVVAFGALPGSAQGTTTTTDSTTTTAADSTTTTAAPTTTAPSTTAEPSSTAAPSTTAADTSSTASTAPTSSTATTAPATTDPDRQKVEAAEAAKGREVDAANAKLGDLTSALAALQSQVEAQAAELDIATRKLAEAESMAEAAEEDVTELEARVIELEYGLSDQAIRSFKGEVVEDGVLSVGTDPTQAIRMQAMLAKATQSDIDYVNALAGVREDLSARRVDAAEAVAQAAASQEESEAQLAALEDDRLAQGQLASAAESRLDHLLSERAALARLGADLDSGLDPADTAALVAQIENAPAPAPRSTSGGTAPATVSRTDIRSAGKGIEVHVDIVDNVRQLLADAAADGVDLAGGGYRDPAQQIAVRRNNCGTSNYAIYEMRSSQCSPPTARPGRSQHEQGKAIDFTHNGSLIRSRSGAGWNWLNANANKYGLYNLPSEPWHWSVNGR